MQSLETETEILWDRDQTWDIRDRDWGLKKRVSRPRPGLETPSLSITIKNSLNAVVGNRYFIISVATALC